MQIFLVLTLLLGCVFTTYAQEALALRTPPFAEVPDTATLKAAGIRTLQSRHLTLYTDLPAADDVDTLPDAFDKAVPQWAKFFAVDPERLRDWHVVACVMQDGQRFIDYQLQPDSLPAFEYGMQRGNRIWVREQPSAYYRRHLVLHEGTHAVMNEVFGRVGPIWYREGIADLLGTHRYVDGRLELNAIPKNRNEVKYWGRIRIIHDDLNESGGKQIDQIVDLPSRAFLSSKAYAWSWALQSFLHRQPKYAELCKSLRDELRYSDRGVTEAFLRGYQRHRDKLDYEWNLYVQHLDYGYDSTQETIQYASEVLELEAGKIDTRTLDTTQGWQAAGIRVPPNCLVDIAARGRFQIAEERIQQQARVWNCEPQGVTIEYYQGRPLGKLLAAIVPEAATAQESRFDAVGVGRRGEIATKSGGQLYFRINERADRLGDNAGKITVKIRWAKEDEARIDPGNAVEARGASVGLPKPR